PRIIAEKYMENNDDSSLKDYKFFCFNNEIKMTLIVSETDLKNKKVNRNFYDENWNLIPLKENGAKNSDKLTKKPDNYKRMIEIAKELSKDIPFVRVDLYEINGKIYFGEPTFYPQNGY